MIVTANARLAISVKATRNHQTGTLEIRSIVLPIDFSDILSIDVFGYNFMDIVHYANKSTHIKEKPIVDQALRKMREKYKYPMTFGVKIQKNIPTGHGLGSGSSNAMATINAVNRLAKLHLNDQDILEMAKTIGQDVPFFAINKPAYFEYYTHKVIPLKVNLKMYVLVLINKKIIEREEVIDAFIDYGEENPGDLAEVINALEKGSLRDLGKVLVNDFSEVIMKKTPELLTLLSDLRNLGVEAYGIAGTGTTIFALSENKNLLKYIGDKYRRGNYDVIITKILK